jgi:hypothetical protein
MEKMESSDRKIPIFALIRFQFENKFAIVVFLDTDL